MKQKMALLDPSKKSGLLLPVSFAALSLSCIGLGIWLSFLCGLNIPDSAQHLPAKFLFWDAGWYHSIAAQGYAWNPRQLAGNQLTQQNIAFFPLYPAIEFLAGHLLGGHLAWAAALVSLLAMVASIYLFWRLAQRLQAPDKAARSALCFALYPANVFCAAGYPVSLMNLLCIAALLLALRRQWVLAAIAAGIATAAGPLPSFVAFSITGWYFFEGVQQPKAPRRLLLGTVGIGALSLCGLLAFMLYQMIAFGTPRAFIDAQVAWGTASLGQRLENLVTFKWLFAEPAWARFTPMMLGNHPVYRAVYQYEQWLNELTCAGFAAAYGWLLVLHLKKQHFALAAHRLVLLPGICVFAAYIWFVATINGPDAANRLLFLSFPAFLAAGELYRRFPRLVNGMLLIEAVLLLLQTLFFFSALYVI